MAITFGSIGAKSSGGTTTLSIAYPASPASTDLFLAGRCMWDHTSTVADETGWTSLGGLTGGADNNAADDHSTRIRGDSKVSDGTETGSVTFDSTVPATVGGGLGIMARYARSAGSGWTVDTTTGTDDTHTTNRSVTGSGSLSFAAGDWLVAIVAVDTNATLSVFSSPALTASGITFGTTTRRAADGGVGTGNDGCIEWFDAEVSSGSGTVAPTLAFNTTQAQCGPVLFIRLRETASGTDATVSAVAIATTTAMPAPALQTGETVAATAIATTTGMPAPSVSTGGSVNVATVAIATTTGLPAPAIQTGSTVAAIVVHTVTAMPAPTVGTQTLVAATAIATTTALPAPGFLASSIFSVTAIATTTALPAPNVTAGEAEVESGGSWWTLLAVYRDAAMLRALEESLPPRACPNDGTPLEMGPHGELFCPFDGWQP